MTPHCTPFFNSSGRPVPDCAVPAEYIPEFKPVLADEAGRFTVPAVPQGAVFLHAEATGYFDEWPIRRTPEDPLGVFSVHGPIGDIELRLLPSASLRGIVLGEAGRPLPDWPVALSETQVSGQGFTTSYYANQTVKSGSDGRFIFSSLFPGDYFLTSGLQSASAAADETARVYPPGLWPDSEPGLPVPRTVHLEPAGSAFAAIHIPPKPLHHVTGRFTPMPASQVDAYGFGVFVVPEYGGFTGTQTIARDHGAIDFLLPDGRYKIIVQHATDHAEALVEVAGGDVSGVALNVGATVQVPVHVSVQSVYGMSGSHPFSGRSLLEQAVFGFSLSFFGDLHGGQGFGTGTGSVAEAPSPDASGLAHSQPLSPGAYPIVTEQGSFWYVASVRAYDHDLAAESYVVTDQEHAAPIEVELRDDGGSLAGIVQNGEEPASAFVYALPLFPSTTVIRRVTAHADGKYHLEALAPGKYRILALDHEVAIPFREDISPWLTRGQAVTVGSRSELTLNLRLEP